MRSIVVIRCCQLWSKYFVNCTLYSIQYSVQYSTGHYCSLAILGSLLLLDVGTVSCCCRRPRSDLIATALSLADIVRLRGPVGLLRPRAAVLPAAAAAATAWLE